MKPPPSQVSRGGGGYTTQIGGAAAGEAATETLGLECPEAAGMAAWYRGATGQTSEDRRHVCCCGLVSCSRRAASPAVLPLTKTIKAKIAKRKKPRIAKKSQDKKKHMVLCADFKEIKKRCQSYLTRGKLL